MMNSGLVETNHIVLPLRQATISGLYYWKIGRANDPSILPEGYTEAALPLAEKDPPVCCDLR